MGCEGGCNLTLRLGGREGEREDRGPCLKVGGEFGKTFGFAV